ncbi:HAD family hydrolase [Sedimentibacter sp. B4]|uniref:P-type ATPase n=1 Tax=Sedimentibacter sp. B4 TaxID=304766 RepID=UPI00031266F9|nr:HAD family hydrolase [Sedimentibacter sp. B4]
MYRDGSLTEVPTSEVVKGDFVKLEQGDRIPADGILIDGQVDVDQSSLNGETKEAHKVSAAIVDYDKTDDMNFSNPHLVFNSSTVCQGSATMLVTAVGEKTYYGRLAIELQHDKSDSPLKERLKDLAAFISRIGYLGAFLILVSSLFKSIALDNHFNMAEIIMYMSNPYTLAQDVIRALTLAVTIIVVAVPEGLPVMITVVLSSNMKRMIKDNVLVRKLVGIETAGSLNILFTDKTGTLTVGKMQVSKFISGNGKIYENMHNLKEEKNLWKIIYISSVYNNGSIIGHDGKKQSPVGGNSTDRAMLGFAMSYPVINADVKKLSEISFDSKNKFSASSVTGDLNVTLLKGAPDKILPFCTHYYCEDGTKSELNNIFQINKLTKDMSSAGNRLLALATSDAATDKLLKGFSNLTLVGIACIKDELRKDAAKSIEEVTNAGVQVVMITGDGKETAVSIGKESNLLDYARGDIVLTSDDMKNMTDDQLKKYCQRSGLLPELCLLIKVDL